MVGLQWGSAWIHNGTLSLEEKRGWAGSHREAEAGTKADPQREQPGVSPNLPLL